MADYRTALLDPVSTLLKVRTGLHHD